MAESELEKAREWLRSNEICGTVPTENYYAEVLSRYASSVRQEERAEVERLRGERDAKQAEYEKLRTSYWRMTDAKDEEIRNQRERAETAERSLAELRREWVRVEDIKKLIDEINRQYSWQSEATRALGDLRRKLLAPPSEGRKAEPTHKWSEIGPNAVCLRCWRPRRDEGASCRPAEGAKE